MKNAVVWGQSNCTYCDMAVALLISKGYSVEERKIGSEWSKLDLLNAVPNARSVPQIFLDNTLVPGGYPGLIKFFNV